MVREVVIIGGGLSGTLCAVQLLRQAIAPLRVRIVERAATCGLGLAYHSHSPGHVLNVPASGMSALPDQPGHFLDWLDRQYGEHDPHTFVARGIYGLYLQSLLAQSWRHAPAGVTFEHVRAEAVGLDRDQARWRVSLLNAHALEADVVVLALGYFLPHLPSGVIGSLAATPLYHANPWHPDAIEDLSPGADVLLLGSGPTSVDLVVSLAQKRHHGRIHVLSRRGLLPLSHSLAPTPHFTLNTEPPPGPLPALLRWIRVEARHAERLGQPWTAVLDALKPYTASLWNHLSLEDRLRFRAYLQPYWDIHRRRIAPRVAQLLKSLQASGQLQIHAGRLLRTQPLGSKVRAVIRPRGAADPRLLTVSRIINGTGPNTEIRDVQHPLVQDLLSSGLARPDALGVAFDTDFGGSLIGEQGTASGLYTLGALRRGTLLDSTGVPEVRQQAQRLAQTLLSSRSESSPAAPRAIAR